MGVCIHRSIDICIYIGIWTVFKVYMYLEKEILKRGWKQSICRKSYVHLCTTLRFLSQFKIVPKEEERRRILTGAHFYSYILEPITSLLKYLIKGR